MFTWLNLTPQPGFIPPCPAELLSCGQAVAAAAFPACPRLCWAAPFAPCLFQASSPSWRFYFLNLRTAGSLVLPSQSVYSAAGFRKSALVPLPAHSFPPSRAELLQRDSASFCSHQDPALGSSKCSPAEKSSSFHFVQSWAAPSCLLCGFVGGVSDVSLILRGAAERDRQSRGNAPVSVRLDGICFL